MPQRRELRLSACTALAVLALSCSDQSSDMSVLGAPASAGSVATGGAAGVQPTVGSLPNLMLDVGGAAVAGGASGGRRATATLPAGFTRADVGGYLLGATIDASQPQPSGSGGGPDQELCQTTIHAVIRDFRLSHPDFEHFMGDDHTIVSDRLGTDRKPVFKGPAKTVTSKATFDQWYRGVDGVNQVFAFDIFFQPANNVTSFQSNEFFPLDEQGFGNEGKPHNFAFTTEIHTSFKYSGGEHFNFQGDDDVWVFLNDQLVVDLGGVHEAETAQLDVDSVASQAGLVTGNVYRFDMFQAERHSVRSNFHADTDLDFVDCGRVVQEPR